MTTTLPNQIGKALVLQGQISYLSSYFIVKLKYCSNMCIIRNTLPYLTMKPIKDAIDVLHNKEDKTKFIPNHQ